MSRPVIGVAAYVDQARWDIWDTQAAIVPQSYVRAIARSGGLPVILPPSPANAELVSQLDGVVLTAGADIDPSWYGAARHAETEPPRPDRDAGEFALLRAALAADIPVLGVCRGLQLLVIEYGGTLHQHLPESHGHGRHCPRTGEPGWHGVTFVPGTRTGRILGAELVNGTDMVTSHHHQGVAHPGGLQVTARADDGLIEAVEDPARRFVVGVQWHPELQDDHRLFAALVAAGAEQNVRSA
jgi:putative glutamine amidotransferase